LTAFVLFDIGVAPPQVQDDNEKLLSEKQELTRTILMLRKNITQLQQENDSVHQRYLAAEDKLEKMSCVLDRYP
jgi:cell division septum initiation protein DivIVA